MLVAGALLGCGGSEGVEDVSSTQAAITKSHCYAGECIHMDLAPGYNSTQTGPRVMVGNSAGFAMDFRIDASGDFPSGVESIWKVVDCHGAILDRLALASGYSAEQVDDAKYRIVHGPEPVAVLRGEEELVQEQHVVQVWP